MGRRVQATKKQASDEGIAYYKADDMKTVLRVLGWLLLASTLLALIALSYSTIQGYTTWFFRVNGQVTVDGRKTSGYMHANTQKTILLLTRTDGSQPETYLVPFKGARSILDCGNWNPTRFLPAPVGDLNPPCSRTDAHEITDAPISATLIFQPRSVEFSTASGKKIKAEW